jgi:ribokinase
MLVSLADPLILNTAEASALLDNHDAQPPELARQLAARARSAIVTAGSDGAYLAYDDIVMHTRGVPAVRVVDTTGAGDAFAGTLAGHLANGRSLAEAARLANAEAARVVQVERTNR